LNQTQYDKIKPKRTNSLKQQNSAMPIPPKLDNISIQLTEET